MDTYLINITKYAEEQLKETVHYITNELQAYHNAL